MDFEAPWTDAEQWMAWTPQRRRALPIPFGSGSDTLEDGSAYRWSWTLESVDPYDRLVVRRVRYEILEGGDVVYVEEHRLRERRHFPTELRLLLERAGFADVPHRGRIRAPASVGRRPLRRHACSEADDRFAVMLARKPLDGEAEASR